MGTVLTILGLRVVIYLKDHRPAHVRVIGNGLEAVFKLNCPRGPPELRHTYGFSSKELATIRVGLAGRLSLLCDEWRRIHGYF
jgi:hypothetical protein